MLYFCAFIAILYFHFCSLSYHFLAGKDFLYWYILDGCQQTKPVTSERFGIKSDYLFYLSYLDLFI